VPHVGLTGCVMPRNSLPWGPFRLRDGLASEYSHSVDCLDPLSGSQDHQRVDV